MTDWYFDNLNTLITVLACSFIVFAITFIFLIMRVKQRFGEATAESQTILDTPEVALIKVHTRTVRLLSIIGMFLQAVLLYTITTFSMSPSTYSLSLVRPVINLCVLFLGFMTSTHAAFRLASLLLLGHIIVLDTIAEVSFSMVINCMQMNGIQCGDGALSLSLRDLKFLKRRELASLFLSLWLTLETAYLCVAIGFCSSRHSERKLSLSRPAFSLHAALVAHYPLHLQQPTERRKPHYVS